MIDLDHINPTQIVTNGTNFNSGLEKNRGPNESVKIHPRGTNRPGISWSASDAGLHERALSRSRRLRDGEYISTTASLGLSGDMGGDKLKLLADDRPGMTIPLRSQYSK